MPSVFDDAEQFAHQLGSWWCGDYDGADQIYGVVQAMLRIAKSNDEDVDRIVDSYARTKIAPLRTKTWMRLRLPRIRLQPAGDRSYDTDINFDDGWEYDVDRTQPRFVYELPKNIVDIAALANYPAAPDAVLTGGLDFIIENNRVISNYDLLEFQNVLETEDTGVDSFDADNVEIWAYGVSIDYSDMYRLFGYIAQIKKASSEQYNRIVNTYLDCLISGVTENTLFNFILACFDEPQVKNDVEIVEAIYANATEHTIITDREVYKHSSFNTTLVAVGDVVRKGNVLSDAIQLFENLADANLVTALIDLPFLAPCLKFPVILENRDLPLIITNLHGFTKLSWELPGDTAQADEFFDYVHEQGLAATRQDITCVDRKYIVTVPDGPKGVKSYHKGTLAHYLDTRVNLTSEPTSATLPTTINPYKFFAKNVFQSNLAVIVVKLPPRFQGKNLDVLRKVWALLPPTNNIYFVLELPTQVESIGPSFVTTGIDVSHGAIIQPLEIDASVVDVATVTFREI